MINSVAAGRRVAACVLAAAFAWAAVAAHAQPAAGTGAFPNFEAARLQLQRGVSTKADVQRLLGVPSGAGGALLPGYGDEERKLTAYQLWYYEDIEITDTKAEGEEMSMKMRQQILAVFFKGDRFHGYFWTTSSGAAQIR
jgi:hypothetical protein